MNKILSGKFVPLAMIGLFSISIGAIGSVSYAKNSLDISTVLKGNQHKKITILPLVTKEIISPKISDTSNQRNVIRLER